MRNPWLEIPAADYVGHMVGPEVGQLPVLSRLLREALEQFRPHDLLLLGCSTGNGLAHVDPTVTRSGKSFEVLLFTKLEVLHKN